MEKMRNGADLLRYLIHELRIVCQHARSIVTKSLTSENPHVHGDGCQDLADAVVEVPSQAAPLLILHLQKIAGELAEFFVGFAQLLRALLDLFFEVLLRGIQLEPGAPGALTDGDDNCGEQQKSRNAKNFACACNRKGAIRWQKPVPYPGNHDRGGQDRWTQATEPGAKNHPHPNRMVRIGRTEERLQGEAQQQRRESGNDGEQITEPGVLWNSR